MSVDSSYSGGILKHNFDRRKIFIWNNRFDEADYTNTTGSEITLSKGRLMGRITVGQKLKPHVSTSTDGSEQPIGILADDYVVANNDTVPLKFCRGGDVDSSLIILGGTDTLNTLIGSHLSSPTSNVEGLMSIRDAITRNTTIILTTSTENTKLES